MLLMLDEPHKAHLRLLSEVSQEAVYELCDTSIEFIRNGANPKLCQSIAQKHGASTDTISRSLEAIVYLFTECSKLMLSKVEFEDSMLTSGINEDARHSLTERYIHNRTEIRSILEELALDLPQYHNLEWRLDIQLASRTLYHQIIPLIAMKLDVKDGTQVQSHILQTDPVNLLHLTQSLDGALQEIKTQHSRRILRNI